MLDLLEKAVTEKYNRGGGGDGSEAPSQKRSRLSVGQAIEMIPFIRFDGSMSQERRATAIQSFQEDPRIRVLFISLKFALSPPLRSQSLFRAGGVGLNLTAASTVILVDPWWNPAVEDQAIDRFVSPFHSYLYLWCHQDPSIGSIAACSRDSIDL
jgi:DNA repair protein RAD5